MITVITNSQYHLSLIQKGYVTIWQGNGIAKLVRDRIFKGLLV